MMEREQLRTGSVVSHHLPVHQCLQDLLSTQDAAVLRPLPLPSVQQHRGVRGHIVELTEVRVVLAVHRTHTDTRTST